MTEIHCHHCGGFIMDPAAISYRRSASGVANAVPHTAFCHCEHAIVYGTRPDQKQVSDDFGTWISRS